MDLIFFTCLPVGILTLAIIALHIVAHFIKAPIWLTAVNVVLHIAAITLIFLNGGGYENALILVLISSIFALIESPHKKSASEENK